MQLFFMLVPCLNPLFLFPHSVAAARVHTKGVEHNEHAKSKDLASIDHRAPIQRRAGQNRLGGSRTEDTGDGWLARYQPLEALIPSQQSAASLESFYTSLKEDLTTMMQEGVAPTHAIEASDGETELSFNANGIVPWPVAMKFCDWIVGHPMFVLRLVVDEVPACQNETWMDGEV